MSSPRNKYQEQNGPVNLAVMSNNASSPHSPNLQSSPNNSISPKDESQQQQRPLALDPQSVAKDTSLLESFTNPRLPYTSNPLVNAAYYSSLYRYPGLYSPHAHHSLTRTMQRFEPYPQFLPTVPYSPQAPPPPPSAVAPQPHPTQQGALGPIPISQQNGHNTTSHHKSQMERQPLPSLLPPLNATNPLIAQQHKEMYKESSKMSHIINHTKESNNNNNKSLSPHSPPNNNNLGFKVPSGKEGSLKHRILTRPYDKDGKPQRSPPGITNGLPLNR